MVDFETRKACAKWARSVALEDPATPSHAERVGLAKTFLESIAPRTQESDSVLSHIVFLVRTFAGDEASPAEVETAVAAIAEVCITLEAFGAVGVAP